MNIRSKDLNLLLIFKSIGEFRNLSRAASSLSLSQPAVSHALNRLRENFGDPLFVRTSTGMEPTTRAQEILERLPSILSDLQNLYDSAEVFDPKTHSGRVVLASTDYIDQLILPNLAKLLIEQAPSLQLVTRFSSSRFPAKDLETGDTHIAIAGYFAKLPEGCFKQTLFEETFSCIASKAHPRIKDKLTMEDYLREKHILITPQGDMVGVVDKILAKKNLSRQVVIGSGSFSAPGPTIAQSDLILTIPTSLAQYYERYYSVKIFKLPFEIESFPILQVWHNRFNHDPLQRWVRKKIVELFQNEFPFSEDN